MVYPIHMIIFNSTFHKLSYMMIRKLACTFLKTTGIFQSFGIEVKQINYTMTPLKKITYFCVITAISSSFLPFPNNVDVFFKLSILYVFIRLKLAHGHFGPLA